MSKILELREKRAKAWEAAKAFLDAKRTQEGFDRKGNQKAEGRKRKLYLAAVRKGRRAG